MKMNDIRLIGYDLLQENINYLKSDIFPFTGSATTKKASFYCAWYVFEAGVETTGKIK